MICCRRLCDPPRSHPYEERLSSRDVGHGIERIQFAITHRLELAAVDLQGIAHGGLISKVPARLVRQIEYGHGTSIPSSI